jgi:cysteinyl-tRNA synthetase
MFELVRALNAAIDNNELGTGDVPAVKAAFDAFDQVLAVLALRRQEDRQTTLPPEEIERLVAARQDARKRRDFAEGDRIRQQLLDAGIVLEDSASGTRWKPK